MARDLNQVIIIGRLVRNPEIRYTTSGTPVTKFSVANNMTYMQNNEKKDLVNYFDINVWGNQAVNCEKYLKKGSQVAIIGSLRQNRWADKATGQTRSKVEITANTVQFLSPVTAGSSDQGSSTNMNTNNQNVDDHFIEDPWENTGGNEFEENDPFSNNDDIPF